MSDSIIPAPPTAEPPPPLPSAHDLVVSLIRTVVPVIVGSVLGWLAARGLDLGPEAAAGVIPAVTGLCIVGYYSAVRWLETRHSRAGLLLGRTAQPVYTRPVSELTGLTAMWRTLEDDVPVTVIGQPDPRRLTIRIDHPAGQTTTRDVPRSEVSFPDAG